MVNPLNIVGGLAGGVALIAGYYQISAMYMVANTASTIHSSITSGTKDPFVGKISVEGNFKRKSYYHSEYRALAETGQISEHRQILIREAVPYSVVLKGRKDINSRDDSAVEIISQVWALNYAKEECGRVVKHLADECVVSRTNTRLAGSKHVTVKIWLGFVEKGNQPPVSENIHYGFQSSNQQLIKRQKSRAMSWKFSQGVRQKIYKKVAGLCAKVGGPKSPCSLTSLSIGTSFQRKTKKKSMSARATVAWLQPLGARTVASK